MMSTPYEPPDFNLLRIVEQGGALDSLPPKLQEELRRRCLVAQGLMVEERRIAEEATETNAWRQKAKVWLENSGLALGAATVLLGAVGIVLAVLNWWEGGKFEPPFIGWVLWLAALGGGSIILSEKVVKRNHYSTARQDVLDKWNALGVPAVSLPPFRLYYCDLHKALGWRGPERDEKVLWDEVAGAVVESVKRLHDRTVSSS